MFETMISVAKLPFAAAMKAWRWLCSIVAAPAKLEALQNQLAAASDPRPVCTACGSGRVSALERVNREGYYQPRTKGHCGNAECAKEWRMTDSGQALHSPWQ